jgi:hypothetical protein
LPSFSLIPVRSKSLSSSPTSSSSSSWLSTSSKSITKGW